MIIGNIDIEVERKPIKNLHLAVYPPNGRVHVSSPMEWSDEDIRSYVVSRWDWIDEQRKDIANQARQSHREFVDGESHYVLGVKYRLEVKYAHAAPSVEIHGGVVSMTVRPDASESKRAEVMREYLRSVLKEELAEMVDMNFNYIGQIERGEANVTIKTMVAIADALDVELKTLFDFTF